MIVTANMVRINIVEVQRQWLELLAVKGEIDIESQASTEVEEDQEVGEVIKVGLKQDEEEEIEVDDYGEEKLKMTCRLCLKEFENLSDANHIDKIKLLTENILELKQFRFNIEIPTLICEKCKEQLVIASQITKLCTKAKDHNKSGVCLLCNTKCRPTKTENPIHLKDLAFWLSGERLDQPVFRHHNYCYACIHKLGVTATLRMRSHRIEGVLELQFQSCFIKEEEQLQQIQELYEDDDERLGGSESDGDFVMDDEVDFVFGMPDWNENRESYDDTDEECYPVPLNKPFTPVMMYCEFCNFKTNSDVQLQIHVDVEHMTNGTTCDLCGITVKTPIVLKSHRRRIHYAAITDLCHLCGKMFTASGNYDVHMTTHLDTKDVVCEQCDARFINQKNLKLHMRTHTGEKPYQCRYCEKKFAHPSDRKRHETIHTGIYPYNCSTCGRGFVKKTTFKTHEASHGITNAEEQMIIMEVVKEEEV